MICQGYSKYSSIAKGLAVNNVQEKKQVEKKRTRINLSDVPNSQILNSPTRIGKQSKEKARA